MMLLKEIVKLFASYVKNMDCEKTLRNKSHVAVTKK